MSASPCGTAQRSDSARTVCREMMPGASLFCTAVASAGETAGCPHARLWMVVLIPGGAVGGSVSSWAVAGVCTGVGVAAGFLLGGGGGGWCAVAVVAAAAVFRFRATAALRAARAAATLSRALCKRLRSAAVCPCAVACTECRATALDRSSALTMSVLCRDRRPVRLCSGCWPECWAGWSLQPCATVLRRHATRTANRFWGAGRDHRRLRRRSWYRDRRSQSIAAPQDDCPERVAPEPSVRGYQHGDSAAEHGTCFSRALAAQVSLLTMTCRSPLTNRLLRKESGSSAASTV